MKTTDFTVGDRVIYRPFPKAPPEEGVVTSINNEFVFVCYGLTGSTSKATNPKDLEHLSN